jgi:hypothetical protein
MWAAGLTAVVFSVSYYASLFAQQDVPDVPRPAATTGEALPPVPQDSIEVQTSGPLHEGFATPLTTEVPESIVVDRQPPQPIDEVPPDQRPEGSNVVWIPGYFAWDEERKDFLWISGFWRDVPPGRVWVSGYWTEAGRGWQWVPGFWTSREQREIEYLPQPPEIVESGPSIQQPSANHFWVPGNWDWRADHYVWRPGYWSRINPDWVWVPAHYVWCPSGYVFVNGYWDYPVPRRGLLFAPVYFQPVVYRSHYHYTPSIVWSTALLTSHLWVRPSYYHYYYGDFYHDRYRDYGIRPWYLSFTFGSTSYDPLFSYYRWHHRDRDWDRHVRDRHDYYRRNEQFRPPRTYRDQQQLVDRGGNRDRMRDIVVAAPITQVVNNTTISNTNFRTPFNFDRVAQQERRQIARQSDELRNVVRQRRQLETRDNVAQVDDQNRKGAAKGEEARKRRAAPRTLDLSKAAQAIGVTPDVGAARVIDRAVDRQAGRRPRGDADTRRAGDETGVVTKDAGQNDADARRRGGEIGRPDRTRPELSRRVGEESGVEGPALTGPDIGRPDRVRTAPDAKQPTLDSKSPSVDLDAKAQDPRSTTDGRKLRSDRVRERMPDAVKTLRDLAPPSTTQSLPRSEPRRRERLPATDRASADRGKAEPERGERSPTTGRAIDSSRIDPRGTPFTRRGAGSSLAPSGTPTEAGGPPLSGEPRRALAREEQRRAARSMIESRRTQALQPQPQATPNRTNPVAPLRLGAPQSIERGTPGPTRDSQRSSSRSSDPQTTGADRATTGRGSSESKGRDRAAERRKQREKD